MNLLLDEMWSPDIAVRLRTIGHDVQAVAERLDLRSRSDAEIFAVAGAEGRCVVTENVRDFRRLAAHESHRGVTHHGLIFTSNHRFPRHDARTPGRIVVALDHPLTSGLDLTDREHWLQ